MRNRMESELIGMSEEKMFSSLNSTLGVLSHYRSYNIRRELTDLYYPEYCAFAHCNMDRSKLLRNE